MSALIQEARRQRELAEIERMVRQCPPLKKSSARLIGSWELKGSHLFLYVFSEFILILQQKVELLSRKKYFVIKKEIKIVDVIESIREHSGIRLRMKSGRDVLLMIELKGDDILDAIKAQLKS
jgi:hypothetical protein